MHFGGKRPKLPARGTVWIDFGAGKVFKFDGRAWQEICEVYVWSS